MCGDFATSNHERWITTRRQAHEPEWPATATPSSSATAASSYIHGRSATTTSTGAAFGALRHGDTIERSTISQLGSFGTVTAERCVILVIICFIFTSIRLVISAAAAASHEIVVEQQYEYARFHVHEHWRS
jgi:hypothetical protein